MGPTHFYPPDPSSQIVCSIGGNVAENSGGAHCFKYGFTTNYVTGLELVLPDGELVQLGRQGARPARRYDLLGAFVGSEGTLGVATEITLRVVPVARGGAHARGVLRLDRRRPARWCPTIVAGGHRAGRDRDDGRALDRGGRGLPPAPAVPPDAGAALVVELDGSEAECEARFESWWRSARRRGADSIRVAKDEAERDR